MIDLAIRDFKAKLLYVFFCVLMLSIFYPNLSKAGYFTDECYRASDLGNVPKNLYTVRPVGAMCYNRCKSECGIFSVKVGNVEINNDILEQCQTSCQSGSLYSSYIRKQSSSNNSGYEWSTTANSIQVACGTSAGASDSAAYNHVATNLFANTSDQITLTLTAPQTVGDAGTNTIYMCGFGTTIITPSYESMNANDWNNNPSRWSNCSNNRSWYNARNQCYVDTGVNMKDGDIIAISYGGQYRLDPSVETPGQYALKIKPAGYPILAVRPSVSIDVPGYNLKFEQVDANLNYLPGYSPQEVIDNNNGVSVFGLTGSTYSQPTRYYKASDFGSNNTKSSGTSTVYSTDKYVAFKGALSGFSSNFSRLALMNYDDLGSNGGTGYFYNNIGGHIITIMRRGCPFYNGNRLQYAIGEIVAGTDPNNPQYNGVTDADFVDVPSNVFTNGNPLPINKNGLIYLRIKPYPYDMTFAPSCNFFTEPYCNNMFYSEVPGLFTPGNTGGQYYVVLSKKTDPSAAQQVITNIVTKVSVFLFGDDQGIPGMTKIIYTNFVTDAAIINMIRAALVLYIAIMGLSFMLGISPINQQEGTMRLLKFAFVSILISPDSWNFFNEYLFKLFTKGGLELLVLLTAPYEYSEFQMQQLMANPVNIFTVFNEPLNIIFGKITWMKIAAIILSTPMGFLIAFVIAVAGITYALCIVKAAIIYLISLIGISVLIVMAPIFITFMLFGATRDMFSQWIKQLISFVMQPIFVYTFIVIINYLVLATLQQVLGFSICKVCLFSFSIGPVTDCLIWGYVTLIGVMAPVGNIASPIPALMTSFYFLLLAQSMYVFTNFGAKLAHTIVTGQYNGMDLAETAKGAIDDMRSTGAKILGIDQASMQGGRDFRAGASKANAARKKIRDTFSKPDKSTKVDVEGRK